MLSLMQTEREPLHSGVDDDLTRAVTCQCVYDIYSAVCSCTQR